MADGEQAGIVLVLSGPSGSGKSTLARRLVAEHDGVVFSVSATTRERRQGEQEGVEYYFLSREKFQADIDAGLFLEHARVFGDHLYGTPRAPVEAARGRGLDVALDIDVQGGVQIKKAIEDAVMIFILPPSPEILAERLRARGREDEAAIQRRLQEVPEELGYADHYEYLVINDDLETAYEQLCAIRQAGKCRFGQRRKKLGWKI